MVTASLLSSLKTVWTHGLLKDGLLIYASQSSFQVNAIIANINTTLRNKTQKWSMDSTD